MKYTMNTDKSEAATRREIAEEFRKWNPRYGEPIIETYDFPPPAEVGASEAMVRFVLRGKPITVQCSSQYGYRDNLRCCFYAIAGMRMNEVRGIADTMANAYLQLAAPERQRDPYEVLGIRPDTPETVMEASYKALAKVHHPDKGGDPEKFKEIRDAYERITKEREATP